MEQLDIYQYNLIYNAFSFTFAVMFAATIFFFISRDRVDAAYKTAITITGLVTLIAAYHYLQIFLSFDKAFELKDGTLSTTGYAFNNAYRYVDWLLTVPLLLVELILVMNLTRSETVKKATTLGFAAALMIILGYPGEIADDLGTRWLWWVLSMIPFLYIVFQLVVGLRASIDQQPQEARGLIKAASWVVILAWSFYPIVYLAPMLGLSEGDSAVVIEIGYSIADITAKAGFGMLIYNIAVKKSQSKA